MSTITDEKQNCSSTENKERIGVLALLEAYRLEANAKHEGNVDHSIRVCQAIVAHVFGYKSRADWSDDIQAAKLINYDHSVDTRVQYKTLTMLMDNVRI